MHKYQIIIYWRAEDEVFVAEVLKLPGCAGPGKTQGKAPTTTNDAIQLWINSAREFGDPVPEPKGRRMAFALQQGAVPIVNPNLDKSSLLRPRVILSIGDHIQLLPPILFMIPFHDGLHSHI